MDSLKIKPKKTNTQNFKSVPREFFFRKMVDEKSKIPPIGGYRPKRDFVDPVKKSKIEYGPKEAWEPVGKMQNERVKKGQFEESSKLCMCILKALDQEQVDLKKNKDYQSQLFISCKNKE
jgi:hypothetical protein